MNARELAIRARVSEATVSRLLSGQRGPGLRLIGRLKTILDWPADSQIEAIEKGQYGDELRRRLDNNQLEQVGQPK